MSSVAHSGSVSSFIDPDRSTTKTMSRGLSIAIASADLSKFSTPIAGAKKSGLSCTDAITLTAFGVRELGLNVLRSKSNWPSMTCTSPKAMFESAPMFDSATSRADRRTCGLVEPISSAAANAAASTAVCSSASTTAT